MAVLLRQVIEHNNAYGAMYSVHNLPTFVHAMMYFQYVISIRYVFSMMSKNLLAKTDRTERKKSKLGYLHNYAELIQHINIYVSWYNVIINWVKCHCLHKF